MPRHDCGPVPFRRAPLARGAAARAFALAGLALAAACSKAPPPAGPPPPVPVKVAKAEKRDVPVDLGTIGQVEALSSVSVRAQAAGTLQSVRFQQGEPVRKGQVLFTIDSRPFEAAVAEARAQVARDSALADNADANVARYVELRARNADYVTQDAIDRLKAQAASQRQSVRAGEAAVQRASIDLGYCTIRSPIDARAGDVLVHAGNLVGPSDMQPLVVLLQTKPIQVGFTMPQQNLPEIRRRMAEAPVEVLVKSGGAEPRTGTLAFVDNTVDTATGTIHLKATFPNADEGLWPGQFVDVTLRLGVDRGALVVPATAIQTGQAGTFLYVVKEDGTAESRPVTVARTAGDVALVADGLSDGETVITDGQLRVSPGAKVSPKEDAAPAGANPAPPAETRP